MKKLLLLLSLLLITLITFSQEDGIVSGKITDARSGELLPGLSITTQSGKGKTADMDGRYSVSLPAGTHTLKFQFIGYNTKEITGINIKEGQVLELDIIMERTEEEMAAVGEITPSSFVGECAE